MIKLYERLMKGCQSVNMLNRVHIRLGDWMMPQQYVELRDALKTYSGPDKNIINWLQDFEQYFNKSDKPHPENFMKRRIDLHTVLYTSVDQTVPTQEKTLLVCMTGGMQRMMMPLAVFLQHLDARTTDVIYITSPKREGYFYGIPRYDQSFEEMLTRLGALPFDRYKRLVGMGSSLGGVSIIMLALKYQFDAFYRLELITQIVKIGIMPFLMVSLV